MLDAVYVSMLPPGSGTGTRVYDRMSADGTCANTARLQERKPPSKMSYQVINHRRECCTAVCVKSVYYTFADDIRL